MFGRALLVLVMFASSASAQPGANVQPGVDFDALLDQLAQHAPGLERIAKGAFRRARRAVSIGPTVGVFGGVFPDAEQSDFAISFGLGIEMFKIPIIPSPENIKALVKQRAKEKLEARQISTGDAQQIVREAWDQALQELFGLDGLPYRRVERPKFSFGIEGNRFIDGETWAVRLRGGIGIWKLTLAASLAAAFTDPDTGLYTGVEVVTHLMMAKQPRSSVLDLFVRADFEVANRDVANTDFFGVGARYLVDAF